MIREQLNQLIEDISSYQNSEELFQAKKDYQSISGTIFEDDKSYEARMGAFLEWFSFDRKLAGTDVTPVQKYLNEKVSALTEEASDLCRSCLHTVHSLFQVKKIHPRTVVVQDLLNNGKYEAQEDQGRVLFNRDDIFEGRLIDLNGKFHFSENYCYHPREAASFILKSVKTLAASEKADHKTFQQMGKELARQEKEMAKVQSTLSRLQQKLEKSTKEKKIADLQQEISGEEGKRSKLETVLSEMQEKVSEFETSILKKAHEERRYEMLRRLSYMSLMWERSRQIDIKDIYRN